MRSGTFKDVRHHPERPGKALIEHRKMPNIARNSTIMRELPRTEQERVYIQSRYYIYKLLSLLFPKTILPLDEVDDDALTEVRTYIAGEAHTGKLSTLPPETVRDIDAIQRMGFLVDVVGKGNFRQEGNVVRYVDDVVVPQRRVRSVIFALHRAIQWLPVPEQPQAYIYLRQLERMLESAYGTKR
jgi:hypothetical protein